MKIIEDESLEKIEGGSVDYLSGPVINAIVNVINVLKDAGHSLGSSLRRISEEQLCPLK